MIALLTGMRSPRVLPAGRSVPGRHRPNLVSRLSAGKKVPSLQLAIRWGVGKSFGKPTANNILNFTTPAPASPIPPELDPSVAWKRLFGTLPAPASGSAAWDKSILDAVDKRYVKLGQRLGGADKTARSAPDVVAGTRKKRREQRDAREMTSPTLVDTSDYNPTSATLAQTVYSYDPRPTPRCPRWAS